MNFFFLKKSQSEQNNIRVGNYKSLGRGGASRDSTYPFFATVAAGGSPPPASLPSKVYTATDTSVFLYSVSCIFFVLGVEPTDRIRVWEPWIGRHTKEIKKVYYYYYYFCWMLEIADLWEMIDLSFLCPLV